MYFYSDPGSESIFKKKLYDKIVNKSIGQLIKPILLFSVLKSQIIWRPHVFSLPKLNRLPMTTIRFKSIKGFFQNF